MEEPCKQFIYIKLTIRELHLYGQIADITSFFRKEVFQSVIWQDLFYILDILEYRKFPGFAVGKFSQFIRRFFLKFHGFSIPVQEVSSAVSDISHF